MTDLHMHTLFSDGADSAEDMVLEAIRKGFRCIGFSDHSHLDWDECGMSRENTEAYRKDIERLKVLYTARIRILCGRRRLVRLRGSLLFSHGGRCPEDRMRYYRSF